MRQAYDSSYSPLNNKRNRHIEEQPIFPVLSVLPPLNYYTEDDPLPPLGITSSPPPQIPHYNTTKMANKPIDLVPIVKKIGRPAKSSRAYVSCTDDKISGNLDGVESDRVIRLRARK